MTTAAIPPTEPASRLPGIQAPRFDPRASAFERDLRDALADVNRRVRSGELDRAQARAFRAEASLIRSMRSDLGRDGLSDSERQAIELRTRALQAAVQLPPRGR